MGKREAINTDDFTRYIWSIVATMQFTLCDDLVKKHRINEHERKDLKIFRERRKSLRKILFRQESYFCFKDKVAKTIDRRGWFCCTSHRVNVKYGKNTIVDRNVSLMFRSLREIMTTLTQLTSIPKWTIYSLIKLSFEAGSRSFASETWFSSPVHRNMPYEGTKTNKTFRPSSTFKI